MLLKNLALERWVMSWVTSIKRSVSIYEAWFLWWEADCRFLLVLTKDTVGTSTLGVDNTFRDTLSVKVSYCCIKKSELVNKALLPF